MKKYILSALVVLSSQMAFSHEGHDIPGAVKSVYGGVVKTGKVAHLEYVVSGAELKLYPLAHAGEELPKDLVVSAKAEPKKGGSYELALSKNPKFFTATIDMKGANRLPVVITFKSGKLTDTFKIQVEAE